MRTRERLRFTVFITTTTVCVSELNVLLVYPACSKWKYYASEADCCTSAKSLFPSAHTHLSLSLSLNSIFNFSIQFKCALLAWQKLYICIAKAIAAGLLTNTLSLSLRLLCTASGWKELRFQLKHRYVASLILHASIAEITAQLLSLSYV